MAPPKAKKAWAAVDIKIPGDTIIDGSHHIKIPRINGIQQRKIVIAIHGNKEVPRGTWRSICSTAKLSPAQMGELVKCTFSATDYVTEISRQLAEKIAARARDDDSAGE